MMIISMQNRSAAAPKKYKYNTKHTKKKGKRIVYMSFFSSSS
jgi:hypothetical protein